MLLDIHCHLTDNFFLNNIDETIKKCQDNDVGLIISAGLNPEDNRRVLELSKKYDIIKAALGFYPIDALSVDEREIDEEIEFIKKNKNKIIAISEIGLDYHHADPSKKQKETFEKFIKLSEQISKPLIIHSRKAENDVIDMLESSNAKYPIFHSFGGNKSQIKKIIDKRWYFSIPPIILRSPNFQTLVNLVPLNQLLTETDSPYQGPYKDEKNYPYNVKESIKKISEIKKIDFNETENIIYMNLQKITKKEKTI
jgi:TatD DNase family protein